MNVDKVAKQRGVMRSVSVTREVRGAAGAPCSESSTIIPQSARCACCRNGFLGQKALDAHLGRLERWAAHYDAESNAMADTADTQAQATTSSAVGAQVPTRALLDLFEDALQVCC